MTTNGNEWYNEWQRVIMSGTTGDYKWQRVTTSDNEWQRVTANDNEETENSDEWQRMTASAITNENEWECVK